ncbi:hypothetical protein TNCV_2265131 [Trichonephila clavipes]|nr:hypothetical protein TNCV_2265131 [Trichonephila clavipes]
MILTGDSFLALLIRKRENSIVHRLVADHPVVSEASISCTTLGDAFPILGSSHDYLLCVVSDFSLKSLPHCPAYPMMLKETKHDKKLP